MDLTAAVFCLIFLHKRINSISVFAIRQRAAWASTLITHNIPRTKKKARGDQNKRKHMNKVQLPSVCTYFRLRN